MGTDPPKTRPYALCPRIPLPVQEGTRIDLHYVVIRATAARRGAAQSEPANGSGPTPAVHGAKPRSHIQGGNGTSALDIPGKAYDFPG